MSACTSCGSDDKITPACAGSKYDKISAIVCGWVILFRTLVAFLNAWLLWRLPQWLQVLTIGFLELSNGCCELMRIDSVELRFVICSGMLAVGGICVMLQTISVTSGLSIRNYLIGKGVQTVFSLVVSFLIVSTKGILCAAVILSFLFLFIKIKNKSGNLTVYPV